jgi:hypothetical protein
MFVVFLILSRNVGILGFNAKWNCIGPEDDNCVFLPQRSQGVTMQKTNMQHGAFESGLSSLSLKNVFFGRHIKA